MSDVDLAEGWALAPLRDLGDWGSGGTPLRSQRRYFVGGRIPWLKIGDLNDGVVKTAEENITESGLEDSSAKLLPAGTLLIAMYGSIGKLGVTAVPCATNQAIAFCRPSVDLWYLFWALRSSRDALLRLGKGGTQANISQTVLREFEIPVPPLNEQRRIVEKVEALLARVNAARDRLERVRAILRRFRQSVIAAACSEGDEVELGNVLESVRYGTAVKCLPEPTGTPVLRIPNVVGGTVVHDGMKYARLTSKETAALRLQPGDLLMIRSNGSVSLVGRTAVVAERERDFAYAGYLMRLRLKTATVMPRYVHLALQTYYARVQIELPARSTSGVHNINSEEVRRLTIHLPSRERQCEIVQSVNALLTLANAIERRVATATVRAEHLTHAVLAKAFRGELVPTEAELARREGRNYEPASVLLRRLRGDERPTRTGRTRPRDSAANG